MNKLKQLISDSHMTTYELTKNTGQASRNFSLPDILNGTREITNASINVLSSFARGLGVRLEDILEDYDLDGTSTQIINIKRHVDKMYYPDKKYKEGVHVLNTEKNGFALGQNLKENGFKYETFKKGFEFINPRIPHDKQNTTEIYLLNRDWLNQPKNTLTKNTTLSDTTQKLNSHATSYIVYTPIEFKGKIIGGDVKFGISVYDTKNNFLFTEVYGCEFMDTEDNRNIVYYKGRDDYKPITPELMESIPKMIISEMEFYNNLFSQYWKYGISK